MTEPPPIFLAVISGICRYLRFVKIIMTWEESIVSFWITAVFLAAGLVSLILPWCFILTWTGRTVMWGLFGPHMKLVDLYLQERYRNDENAVKKALVRFRELSNEARVRREEAVKLKAVKDMRFGNFITMIPAFNLTRHYDRPLPQSFARLHRKDKSSELVADTRKALWLPPQQLFGPMIPRAENVFERNKALSSEQMQRLEMLEARLAALKAAEASGGGLERIRRRVSMFRHANEPQASGYELVPSEMRKSLGLCIVPYKEDPKSDANQQLESTPSLTLDSQENADAGSVYEEEGVEIVAWGRLSGSHADMEEENSVPFENHNGAIYMVKANSTKDEAAGTLSMLYRESDSTFIAFYRP